VRGLLGIRGPKRTLPDISTLNLSSDSLNTERSWHRTPGVAKLHQNEDYPAGLECTKLCSYCEILVARIPEVKRCHLEKEAAADWGTGIGTTCESFPYFDSELDLQSSAAGGCSLCSRFTESKKMRGDHTCYLDLPSKPDGLATLTYLSEYHSGKAESWIVRLGLRARPHDQIGNDGYDWRKVTLDPFVSTGTFTISMYSTNPKETRSTVASSHPSRGARSFRATS
jgi:hypothetical protein